MPRPRRGRPTTIEPHAVAATATQLFAERGYEATTMEDVAAAAGVSRRALFNHFPTKDALLWTGFEPFLASLSARLRSVGPLDELLPAVTGCLVGAATDLGPELDLARIRLRIVADRPALVSSGQRGLLAVRELLRDFFAGRPATGGDELAALVLAGAVEAAVYQSLLSWAGSADPTPTAHLQRGMAALASLGAPAGGAGPVGGAPRT
jgi:AcrR family transcriptional regulator